MELKKTSLHCKLTRWFTLEKDVTQSTLTYFGQLVLILITSPAWLTFLLPELIVTLVTYIQKRANNLDDYFGAEDWHMRFMFSMSVWGILLLVANMLTFGSVRWLSIVSTINLWVFLLFVVLHHVNWDYVNKPFVFVSKLYIKLANLFPKIVWK